MKRFFIEIEFKTDIGNTYWIPLFLEAENNEGAKEIKERLRTAFNEHYEIKRISDPKLYAEGINSEFIDDYVNQRMNGRVEALELDVWKIKNIETNPEISFNEGLQMIDLEDAMYDDDKQVAKTLSRHKFPVRVIHKNQDLDDFDEFLLVNVVAPKFWNKLIGAFKNRRV
tara:strand:+ start:1386 stop:1895 length:510 start_codon:yes stop_codon:yes gene_type:complete